jgi:hypothetical protein
MFTIPPVLASSRGVRRGLRFAVSAAIVAYIAAGVDLGDLAGAVRRVRPGAVAVALALYVLGQGLSAWKWSLLGRAVGFARPLREYARFYFIGMFLNLFGPSTVGGDVARGVYLGGRHRPGAALNSVLFDRASGLAVLMGLGAAAMLLFPGHRLPPSFASLAAGTGLALVAGWWTCPRLVRLLPAGNGLRRQVEGDLAPFWRDRRLLGAVTALSLVFHLSQVTVQWLLARAAGVAVPFSYCLVFHPLIALMAALPVSVSGLGVREGGYIYFLTRVGVDRSVALTIGLLWFSIAVVAGLLGGALFVVSGASLPAPPSSVSPTPPPARSPPA